MLESILVEITNQKEVTMAKVEPKKVQLSLVGLDGNAFNLLGMFQRQARKEGWLQAEINDILEEASSGDYDHLLQTLIDHCEDPTEDSNDGFFDDEEPEPEEEEYEDVIRHNSWEEENE